MDELRYQYEALLDEAFEVLGDYNADLATNDTRNEWIESVESVESKLEEMLLMKDSPEKRDADPTDLLKLDKVHDQNHKSNQAFNQHLGKGPPLEKTKVVGANMHQTEHKTESEKEYKRRCEMDNRDIERQLRD